MLEKYFKNISETEITLLAGSASHQAIESQFSDLACKIVYNSPEILSQKFDLAVNLSLTESSWSLMEKIQTHRRLGIYFENEQIRVSDHWSTYLLTLKSPVPFLSFHLEEVFKNILGVKQAPTIADDNFVLQRFVFALSSSKIFPAGEQEAFLNLLAKKFPTIPVLDISEVDSDDVEGIFYIGPADLQPLMMSFPRNLLLQRQFQGANLIPGNPTWILTSDKKLFSAQDLLATLGVIHGEGGETSSDHSLYTAWFNEEEDSFIQQISGTELNYPFYLAYYVLWSFVLGLKESEPAFPKISADQKEFLRSHLEILKKISRFHEYALASLDILLKEARSPAPDAEVIDGHLENLRQIDETLRKISDSHPMLRPLLDFYHVRRGQTEGAQFKEQIENSLLTYHEEHQAFTAFQELLETLEKR